jgi:3-oxoacyl-[acyl-carrier protein] reductase
VEKTALRLFAKVIGETDPVYTVESAARVAFGLIKTRLTEVPAGSGATITVEGSEIKVGINPDLVAMLEQNIPLGRAGTPDEAAEAVYSLCAPQSNYISGQVVVCGGGISI